MKQVGRCKRWVFNIHVLVGIIWYFYLIIFADLPSGESVLLYFGIYTAYVLYVMFFQGARRLTDIGVSRLFLLLYFVPFANCILWIGLMFFGTDSTSKMLNSLRKEIVNTAKEVNRIKRESAII